ncbi:hypothetical protein AVEN_215321-1 [Araneus ventricosus]|uniref:Uncharacterized protein n=1 Tax=Araneus ventricosus TaxID=182803 RepID=A0A4Y2GT85_ARAVE|nr:hypothetical protein AVEN_746-1 [Araneus ventricosus]GBM56818.1 hypothetical protein AVEN_68654-1 [Araneus ventricosus]GBM56824.1 hypothetical protein AVEN_78345-1 [Araneus ventricosus]GBM56899.1 hypothetical protein AVEN_168561-1 [Araneus ventricosus]GBM56908.1 hypothetical protein AVEN_178559-1 [Araneus ventricosus]
MRSRRISKWGIASLVGAIMGGIYPLLVIVRASYSRVRAVAGDGHEDSGLNIRAIAVTITQMHWTALRQDRMV